MQRFIDAWQIVRKHPLGWLTTVGVYSVLAVLSAGLATVLLPNLLRGARAGLQRSSAPSLRELLDVGSALDDLYPMLVWLVACTIAAAVGKVLVVVPLVLLFWVPMLAMDGATDGADAARASFAHSKSDVVELAQFVLVAVAANVVGVFTCIGWLWTMPVTLLAALQMYDERRPAIIATAQAEGVAI